jgi:hypothetical protein
VWLFGLNMKLSPPLRKAINLCGYEPTDQSKVWIERRLARFGTADEAHNVGGLLCTFPHVGGHEADPKECMRVDHAGGHRHIQRFPSLDVGAAVLLAVSRRATATPRAPQGDLDDTLSGYRSVHRMPGENSSTSGTGEFKWSYLIPGYGPATFLMDTFAVSDEARERFRLLQADWEAFEKANVPSSYPNLRHIAEDWIEFRNAWLNGKPDITKLTAEEIQANMVREYIHDKTNDPNFDKSHVLKGGDIVDASPGLKAAATVDREAKDLNKAVNKAVSDLPIEYKFGAVAVTAIVLAALLRR